MPRRLLDGGDFVEQRSRQICRFNEFRRERVELVEGELLTLGLRRRTGRPGECRYARRAPLRSRSRRVLRLPQSDSAAGHAGAGYRSTRATDIPEGLPPWREPVISDLANWESKRDDSSHESR